MPKPGRSSCLLTIALLYASNSVADPVPVEYDTVKTHPDMYVEGGTPEGECVGLVVSNHGEMGYAGLGGVNMDYVESGLECGTRPEDAIYLYSGSPFVIIADDASGANARLTCSYGNIDGSKPYSWIPTGEPGSTEGGFLACSYRPEPVPLGKFLSQDGAIAMERTFYPPLYTDGLRNFVAVETKIYSGDGQPHNHLTMGSVMDWNIPSDSATINTSGYAWYGWYGFVYMQGTDTTGSEACQSNTGRFGAETFGRVMGEFGWGTAWGYLAASQRLLRDTNLARDGVTVIDPPQPDAGAWWDDIGANPGLNSNANAVDQAIWLTYIYDYDLTAADTLLFYSIVATVNSGSVQELYFTLLFAESWFNHVILESFPNCQFCRTGNPNGMGGDEPTISDISVMIDAKFITGTCYGIITCLAEADVNRSGGYNTTCGDITISDMSILIDYLFINGPSIVKLPLCIY